MPSHLLTKVLATRLYPRARARWTVAILAVLAAAPLQAQDAALDLDKRLQALKEETILLNRDFLTFEQNALFPDQSRTTLYVAVKVGGFLIDELTVRINDREPITYKYTDSEARSLLKDGWQRLQRLRLDPGTYRLTGEFKGHFHDARPDEPPVTGKLETLFEKGLSDLDLVLPISRNTRLDKPSLAEVSRLEARTKRPGRNVWLPTPERLEGALSGDRVGGENDPRFRLALFLKNDGRYLAALTELLELQQSVADPAALTPAFKLLLAECYLGFGVEAPAERIYKEIAASKHDAADIARARLQLARFEYQRGYLADATRSLVALGDSELPRALLEDWRQLFVSTLLQLGRYNEAVDLLTLAGDPEDLPPAQQYNFAVALVKDGRGPEGRRALNRVGTMSVTNLETLSLRDKANLTLGYQFLATQQGENAKAVFGRIRTEGPFSNRALLGLGWAELAPRTAREEPPVEAEGKSTENSLGSMLRPGFVDQKGRLRIGNASGSTLSEADRQALLRALVPWVELVKRDPMDPAVQEGMLAVPWALDRLQAYEQSLKYYLDAIAALETARKRMEEALKSIRGGRMVNTIVKRDLDSEKGWTWRMRDLPDAPETYFLQSLLAEHRFQEALKNYRDAQLLTRNLDAWTQRLADLERTGPAVSSASMQRQFERARQHWQPAWAGQVIWLAFAGELAAPGSYDMGAFERREPVDLRMVDPPGQFEGVRERLRPLHQRASTVRPRIDEIGAALGKELERVSLLELEGQKKQIERYLTEARFAVARIYDRQLKEGKP